MTACCSNCIEHLCHTEICKVSTYESHRPHNLSNNQYGKEGGSVGLVYDMSNQMWHD
jgi:hypothetical protein